MDFPSYVDKSIIAKRLAMVRLMDRKQIDRSTDCHFHLCMENRRDLVKVGVAHKVS
jgi:hypothetical protein